MQILKSCLFLGAAAVCILPISARCQDTEAQIKAREAMREKINQLQVQPAEPAPKTPAPAPAPAKKPAKPVPPPVTKPAPTPTQAPSAAKSAPVPAAAPAPPPAAAPPLVVDRLGKPAVETEADIKARAALHQKMQELQQPPPPAPASAVTKTTPATRPPPPPKKSKPEPTVTSAAPKTQPNAAPAAAAKPPKSGADFEPVPGVPVAAANAPKKPKVTNPASAPTSAKSSPKAIKSTQAFKPLQGPPSSLSADKEQRLSDLTHKYQADQITPEEYHQQRAKILAGQ